MKYHGFNPAPNTNPKTGEYLCPCIDCKTRRGEFDAGRAKELKAQAIYGYVDEENGARSPFREYWWSQIERDAPNSVTGGQDFSIAEAKGSVARQEAHDLRTWREKLGARYARPDAEVQAMRAAVLSTDPMLRKEVPIATGVIDYFPLALAAVAALSKAGNDQHNPGKPLHWDRSKSSDESDALMRHFVERGTRDTDGHRHSAKVAWRALALLQKELEADRA